MKNSIKVGQLVRSKLPQHVNRFTTWRVLEITEGFKGKKRYLCECSHDTKNTTGFDSIKYEFVSSEIVF